MEVSIKSLTLFAAVVLTGLAAGFFYSWSVSVILGTRRITDMTYLQTMQSINREILNPAFFLVFFGSPLLLSISAFQQFNSGLAFWLVLSAAVTYLIGTFGVTAFGNVPLNDALDVLDLSALSKQDASAFRKTYEVKWNKLHNIRTGFSVLAFALSLLVLFTSFKIS
ncbi:MAG: DUF1772 domain-containing protein [Mameliella sp.]|nr:DUF1772 domain-containing protein [Phaeodactylibacter sp.]